MNATKETADKNEIKQVRISVPCHEKLVELNKLDKKKLGRFVSLAETLERRVL